MLRNKHKLGGRLGLEPTLAISVPNLHISARSAIVHSKLALAGPRTSCDNQADKAKTVNFSSAVKILHKALFAPQLLMNQK